MVLQVHLPTSPLDQFIEALIYYDGFDPIHKMDRFLPDGNTEIIIDLTERPQHIYDNETLKVIQTCRHAWVSGVRTQPITIPSGKGSRMLIVAFKKGKAYPFYPMPMSEIHNAVVSADLIFGCDIVDLRDQLLAASSADRMFCLAEHFLIRRAGDSLDMDSASKCIGYAVSSILTRPNKVGFDQLSDQIGYSQKHFISLFKDQVGVPPKQYMKIMRFQKAILEIEKDTSTHWSEIAVRNGFYDQSHFIHEFRAFSGFTPSEYVDRKTDMLNYVPVG
jgi:AraC-like DNA-binding protein